MSERPKILTPQLLVPRGPAAVPFTTRPAPASVERCCSGEQDIPLAGPCPPGVEVCPPFVPGPIAFCCTNGDVAQTDYCCAGSGWTPNDMLDHAGCVTNDAPWGGTCVTGWWDTPS